MKKLLFGILFLCIVQLSFAQTSKGTKLLGIDGNMGLNFIDNNDDQFFLSLNPSYGVFVEDKFAIGGELGLEYQKLGASSSTAFSLLPFGRYYFGETGSYQFFAEAAIGLYLQGQQNNFGSDNETALRFQVGPGAAFFLSDKVSIDLQLSYDRIGGNFDFSRMVLFFGFQVYLNDSEK